MYRNAQNAYDLGAKTSASGRELESAALFKAARLLEACRQRCEDPANARTVVEALRFNQRLWTFFQSELANPSHPMPRDLRVNLLRLSAFIDKRTLEMLGEPTSQGLQALIDTNRHIAEGLATRPVGVPQADSAPR